MSGEGELTEVNSPAQISKRVKRSLPRFLTHCGSSPTSSLDFVRYVSPINSGSMKARTECQNTTSISVSNIAIPPTLSIGPSGEYDVQTTLVRYASYIPKSNPAAYSEPRVGFP